MDSLRREIVDSVEVALVELRGIIQPHEIAALNELKLDAMETKEEAQLSAIAMEVKSLIAFCEGRRLSAGDVRIDLRGRRL